MCMLFIKPSGFTLPKEYFDSLKAKNNDGLAIYNKKTGEVFKTLDYKVGAEYLEKNHSNELVVHFRYGTSGAKSKRQLHGFDICKGEYLFFHNGVMRTVKGDGWGVENARSDTEVFVDMYKDATIEEVIEYLETYEKASRFLIVNKKTKEYLVPKCANWDGDATINGTKINFSNSYAIDWRLLDEDSSWGRWGGYGGYGGYDDYGYTGRSYSKTSSTCGNKITGSNVKIASCSSKLKTDKDQRFYEDLFNGGNDGEVYVQIAMIDALWSGNFDKYDSLREKYPNIDVDRIFSSKKGDRVA